MNKTQKHKMTHSHPRSLYILIFAGFFERFSFYGTLTVLLLYLIQYFSFSETNAYATWGTFIALGYITPALGGLLADYLLGFEVTLILGSLLLIAGYALFACTSLTSLYIGMALALCGGGLYKGSSSSLVGMLYTNDDIKRHDGYSQYFIGMTFGSIISPFIAGLLVEYINWKSLFFLSSLGNLLGLLLFISYRKKFVYQSLPQVPKILAKKFFSFIKIQHILFISFLILLTLLTILFSHPILGNNFLGVASISILLSSFLLIYKSPVSDAKKIIGLTVLNLLLANYYAGIFQINGSLILGIEKELGITIFNWKIPATSFASMQALFSILLIPLIAKFWLIIQEKKFHPSILFKVGVGIFMASIGFAIMSFIFYYLHYSFLTLIIANLFLGISTAIVMPIHLSAVSQYAPHRLQGTLMGASYLADAFGGFVGSNAIILTYSHHLFKNTSIYTNLYFNISIALLFLTLIWICLAPLLLNLFSLKTQS